MKKTVHLSTFAAILLISGACNTTSNTEGSATTAVIAETPKPQQSINTSKPETLLSSAPVDEETKSTVENEIAKHKDTVKGKDTDSLMEEAKKHMSEEEISDAVKKLKSVIKGYGDKDKVEKAP